MQIKKVLVVVFITLLVSYVLGCSEKAVKEDPRLSTPEKTYEQWLDTGAKGDIVASLDYVTEESKRLVDMQAKVRDIFVKRLTAHSNRLKEYKIIDAKVKEERAIILLKGPEGDTQVIPLKKDSEGWKVDLIAMFSGK